ncbi:MAG TPA: hypothetical protein VFD04_00655 [Actinomycetes bacterium]|jgi:hypothetical protein|nr:hypothetical protein [Actinomycetes bacterium]
MQTFLVRVWTPGGEDAGGEPAALRGVVEHVATRRSRPFQGEPDLLEFIRGCLGAHREGLPLAEEA